MLKIRGAGATLGNVDSMPDAAYGAMEHESLSGQIIGCAIAVHSILGPGYLELVYRNALAYELRHAGLDVEREKRIAVRYRDVVVGEFVADLFVEGTILVELKAVRALAVAHNVQVVNYLSATGCDVGLLFNFGGRSLEYKRKARLFGQ